MVDLGHLIINQNQPITTDNARNTIKYEKSRTDGGRQAGWQTFVKMLKLYEHYINDIHQDIQYITGVVCSIILPINQVSLVRIIVSFTMLPSIPVEVIDLLSFFGHHEARQHYIVGSALTGSAHKCCSTSY